MISQTWRIKRFKSGLGVWGWHDGPMSCSCNDPEDSFCKRNPKSCAVAAAAGVCILLITPIPDDIFIPALIGVGAGAAAQ
jgi:hypothetical protein